MLLTNYQRPFRCLGIECANGELGTAHVWKHFTEILNARFPLPEAVHAEA